MLLVLVGAAYLALAQFVIWLNDPVQLGAGFWPAAGLSLGLLLLTDRSQWPWILAGVAIAEVVGDLAHGYRGGAIALWTIGNVLEPIVAATAIRGLFSLQGFLAPLRNLVGFIAFGVVVGPLMGGTVGSLGTVLFYGMPAAVVWPKYVVGDALGVLVVAPLLLTWSARPMSRTRGEAAALGVTATLVTAIVFRNWGQVWDVALPYLVLPVLTWAALRFGVRGAALVGFGIANIANATTAFGYGPFAIAGGAEYGVTLLQVFLVITLISGLVLAALASDLTDSRELARQQAAHAAEIQRTDQFRDAFVGILSHEIRTPITTILGMSHLLRKRHASMSVETREQYLDDIGAESDRLRRLTEDLLVLSRAEGGQLVVAMHPIAMKHLVEAVIARDRARETNHAILLKADAEVAIVQGEDVYVEQVIRNFVGNAIKYSPAGSTVTVSVASASGGVEVRVTDEGGGLPDGEPDRLFELFYRAKGAVATSSGAGIGLFVCRELVQAMGGRVWARPAAVGTGAEFGFWLPAATWLDGDDA
ncbi:MAG TPA: MASE1 domain-containing protein [Candidatus Limnocylindria bacterium]|nr:MASE1 domain-containing protein [Candidatus Limnocylindria bacterium]